MTDPSDTTTAADPLTEGARARNQGRPKDSCPYPAGSRERTEWLEGFDGMPADPVPGLSFASES